MTEQLLPRTRITLIHATQQAMQGQLTSAIAMLTSEREFARAQQRLIDLAALTLKQAELLYFDCQEEAAKDLFQKELEPLAEKLNATHRIVVDQNRNLVERTLWSATSIENFYRTVDLQRVYQLAKIDWGAAEQASAAQQYYQSIPMLWRHVVHAYREGSWTSLYHAQRRFGKELFLARALPDAAFYAMIAQDIDLTKQVGQALSSQLTVEPLVQTLNRALSSSFLLRHVGPIAVLIAETSEVIPKSQLDAVVTWLLFHAQRVPKTRDAQELIAHCWAGVGRLARHLNDSQASLAVDHCLKHPLLLQPNPHRRILIQALAELVPKASAQQIPLLIELAVGLVQQKHLFDYRESIELLRAGLEGSDEALRTEVAKRLELRKGNNVPLEFWPLIPIFGMHFSNGSLEHLIARAEGAIRLQVQRVAMGAQPVEPHPYQASLNTSCEGGQIYLYVFSGESLLSGIISCREWLTSELLTPIIDALLVSLQEPENIPANKEFLLEGLEQLTSQVEQATLDKVFAIVEQLARGTTAAPKAFSEELFRSQLSPVQINVGSSVDVQGRALRVLVVVDQAAHGRFSPSVHSLIEEAITNPNERVRLWAFSAMSMLEALPDDLLLGALMGTRDGSPHAASAAFMSLAAHQHINLTESQGRILLGNIKIALQSPHIALRQAATRLLTKLKASGMAPSWAQRIEEIEAILANDVAHSVRDQLG